MKNNFQPTPDTYFSVKHVQDFHNAMFLNRTHSTVLNTKFNVDTVWRVIKFLSVPLNSNEPYSIAKCWLVKLKIHQERSKNSHSWYNWQLSFITTLSLNFSRSSPKKDRLVFLNKYVLSIYQIKCMLLNSVSKLVVWRKLNHLWVIHIAF